MNMMTPLPVVQTHDLEIEHGLLGILLFKGEKTNDVLDILKPEHFSDPFHQEIYAAISDLHNRNEKYDMRTVAAYIYGDDWVHNNGGKWKYLTDLVCSVVTASCQARDYAATIRRMYAVRMIENASADMRMPAAKKADVIQKVTTELNEFELQRQTFYTAAQSYDMTLDKIEATHQRGGYGGLRTGIDKLDEKLCGLDGGGVYVVAGRPAMGKTAFALTAAVNVALQGHPVLFFSLEMAHDQLLNRLLARFAKVTMKDQRSGMPYGGFDRLIGAGEQIKSLPLHVEDISGQTAAQIGAIAKRDMLRRQYKLIVIDHLAIIKDPPYINNRAQAVAQSSAEIKALAKALNVPILLLHQLNRGVEGRDDKRPSLADLRDSGAVEQDADAVMMLYRPEYYMKNEPDKKPNEKHSDYAARVSQWHQDKEQLRGKAEVLIEKNRQGETGAVTMNFNGMWQTFEEDKNEVV